MKKIKNILRHNIIDKLWPFDWIYGRHACLGYDVLQALKLQTKLINFQKARVDSFIESNCVFYNDELLLEVKRCMPRDDVFGLIVQQQHIFKAPKHPPRFILMDSYSELTDQMYRYKKNGWKFFCNSNDLEPSDNFRLNFQSCGLLPNNKIRSAYEKYFDYLQMRYPNTPIIFLHIPKMLEARDYYLERNDVIREAISSLANDYEFLYPISIDENVVNWRIDGHGAPDYYPYHYNRETYLSYAESIASLNLI